MKDGFVFYKSYYEAINELNDDDQLKAYRGIATYALTGEDIEIEGYAKVVVNMAKPLIDASIKRYENGKKGAKFGKLGGRPKKNPTPEENTQEKPKTEEKPAKEKEPKRKYGEYAHVLLTDKEYTALCEEYGDIETGRAIVYLDEYIERKGYKAKSHYLCIRKWVFDAIKEDEQKKAKISNFEKKGTFDDIFKEMGQL